MGAVHLLMATVAGCSRMHEELKAGGEVGFVAAQVAGCVGKAVRLLAEKAEYMAATGEVPMVYHPLL